MKLPTWFIDALESECDRERAVAGKLKAMEKVIVCCQKCGKQIETVVKSKVTPKNLGNPDFKIMCKSCAIRGDEDLIGKKFGQLTIIRDAEPEYNDNGKCKPRKVVCRCDCGRIVTPYLEHLKTGASTSCGKHRSVVINNENDAAILELKKLVLELLPKKHVLFDTNEKLPNYQNIDIYIDKIKLGIIYVTNSSISERLGKTNNSSKELFISSEKLGIRIIQIFENDWKKDKEKIKLVLKDILVTGERVYARKCNVIKIDRQIAKDFYDKYHLQGNTNSSSINYALIYKDELVAVMGFGSSNYHSMNKDGSLKRNDNSRFELHRYAVKFGFSIIGGASKLLKAFEREYKPSYLLSYSANDWFKGEMYEKLGFKFTGYCQPRYYWVNQDKVLNREECQLKRLSKRFPILYKEALDNNAKNKETYVMTSLGYVKICRAGTKRWEKIYNNQ